MNLLITGAFPCSQEERRKLELMGHSLTFLQQEADALSPEARQAEAVICNGLFLHHDISEFGNLRYIQLTSAGWDRVPLEEIEKRGITIHNARGVYSIPMAEFAVGGVLRLYKESSFFGENQKAHIWNKHRALRELYQQEVCIVGCGSVGNECATRFRAFGCRVIGVDLSPRTDERYDAIRPLQQLDACLQTADVVVLTLPLTEETRGLMDRRRLQSMKAGAILVNIARGAIVDTEALVSALSAHTIGGAVLDVFEEEPLPESSALWDLDNTVVTPHNSFVSVGNHERLFRLIVDNLAAEQ